MLSSKAEGLELLLSSPPSWIIWTVKLHAYLCMGASKVENASYTNLASEEKESNCAEEITALSKGEDKGKVFMGQWSSLHLDCKKQDLWDCVFASCCGAKSGNAPTGLISVGHWLS